MARGGRGQERRSSLPNIVSPAEAGVSGASCRGLVSPLPAMPASAGMTETDQATRFHSLSELPGNATGFSHAGAMSASRSAISPCGAALP